jgi:hypothetical protein
VSQLISQVSKLYKDVSNSNNEAYYLGRKEALEEVLNWFITSHNGELKYISATSFFNMMQEKLSKTRSAIKNLDEGGNGEEEIKNTINFSDIRLSDNRKRINRYAMQDYGMPYINSNEGVMDEETTHCNNTTQTNNFPSSIGALINSNNSTGILNNNNTLINSSSDIFPPNQNPQNFPNNLNQITPNNQIINQSTNSMNLQMNNVNSNNQNNIFTNLQPCLFLPASHKKKKFK